MLELEFFKPYRTTFNVENSKLVLAKKEKTRTQVQTQVQNKDPNLSSGFSSLTKLHLVSRVVQQFLFKKNKKMNPSSSSGFFGSTELLLAPRIA
jgi:hypothetical protein